MQINETFKRRGIKTLFWSWHIIYVVIALALILPHVLYPMTESVIKSNTPAYYLLYGIAIALLPFISIAVVFFNFKDHQNNILRYFYGFEMPLLGFLFIKLISLRESNFSVVVVTVNILMAMTIWLYFLWQQNKYQTFPKTLLNNNIALAGSTVIALTGVYISMLLGLFLLPMVGLFFKELWSFITPFKLSNFVFLIHPLFWLAGLFFLFTATIFLILPIAFVSLYLGQFKQFLPTLISAKKIVIVVSVLVLNIGLFIVGNQQPHLKIFTLLDAKLSQPQAEPQLLAQQDKIKDGLLHTYLMPYRYISTTKDSTDIAYSYKRYLGFSKKMAQIPQAWFQLLASPLYYQGSQNDIAKAEKYYETFFDTSIQKAEKEPILRAIKHSWDINQTNEAGLLSANSHLIHVENQTIDITQKQGIANIIITESFKNLTPNQQEIVIHFALPKDAVATGLWLSDDKNKPKMYRYSVAPKGAAQAVYKAEVNRRVDPALLEKVGVNQYRLRIYPIPAKQRAAYFQMQFSYQTLPDKMGQWPLPIVLEKRHVFWDDKTQRRINGKIIAPKNTAQWIPTELSSQSSTPPKNLQSQSIQAVLRQHKHEKISINKPLAVLIDGSYSMIKHKHVLQQAIQTLKSSVTNLDFYFCRKKCDAFKDMNSARFFGNSQTADHLAAFINHNTVKPYGAVLLLSDEGSYELVSKISTKQLNIPAPLWLVHLGKTLPYAYDDKVLDLLYRSKGGISYTVKEALLQINPVRILEAANLKNMRNLITITENRIWFEVNETVTKNPELEKIIAAQKIHGLMRSMDMQKLDNLDRIHAIAKQNSIVTHYSSMLVLVNDRQKEALKKAEAGGDRFEREVEQGKAPVNPFAIPSVPEPEEWALMIIAGILLLLAYRKRCNTENLNAMR